MTGVVTVEVGLASHSYQILIGDRLIERAGELIRSVVRSPRAVLIADQNLDRTDLLDRLEEALRREGFEPLRHLVAPGEGSKSLEVFGRLQESILGAGIERTTPVIAFGGGVVGDLAGFCAATLLRGLDVVQIPTTLLAQVDSAVGGKTGINSKHGKNLIGSFHQPRLVLCDVGSLETLPARELRAGYAEVVKYGLIDRPAFFAWLEANGADLLAGDRSLRQEAIAASCHAKAEIVGQDERESGRRALLNLGHTFGHALEHLTGYGPDLLHGEAVAIGTVLAFALSVRLGLCHQPISSGCGATSRPWACPTAAARSEAGRSRASRCWMPCGSTRRSCTVGPTSS
ncbi:MAG: 3-dehydroquinate synthase [Geminicoccaceae bacterium]|nr:3-dehydroquinate synthase [Geminicoccaceae bacterium]